MRYIAKDNDSLDMICFKHYKTLQKDVYQAFLLENVHLLRKKVLKAGDGVNLPIIEVKQKPKKKYLWE